MDSITISLLIAAIGCIIGVLGFARTTSKDDSEIASAIAVLQNSLDHIRGQIDDLSINLRDAGKKSSDILEIARTALSEAKRANERLDQYERNGKF